MAYIISKNGKDAKHLCVIDEFNKTVSTSEGVLVFDFGDLSGWSFKTGHRCTFNVGSECTFNVGSECTFKTGSNCTFDAGHDCTFKVGDDCTFKVGWGCTFKVGDDCTFKTGSNCTFNTGYGCTFKVGWGCTFKVGENCSLIIWDVDGVTELPVDVTIKLNGHGVAGYRVNTQEWASKYMNDEDGVLFVLKNEEYFEPEI